MLKAMSIAVSGMQAALTRLGASADNTANMSSRGALPDAAGGNEGRAAYKPVRVVQSTFVTDGTGGGTAASLRAVQQAYVDTYEPESTFANADGLVAAPHVDSEQETIEQISAELEFKLNAMVFEAGADMLKTLIEMADSARDRDR